MKAARRATPDPHRTDPSIPERQNAALRPAVRPSHIRKALAQAIARPRSKALLLTASNEGAGWVPIAEAVALNGAFAVEVAADILALDCDRPGLRPVLAHVAELCRLVGIQPVRQASGQPGREHLFARVRHRGLRHQLQGLARERGIDVRSTIRPPLAPHRLGLQPALLEPPDPAAALAALRGSPSRRSLSPRMQALLHNGDPEARQYPSRSEAVHALALGAANAGWTFAELLLALCEPANVGGEKIRTVAAARGDEAARRYLMRSWQAALGRAGARPAVRTPEDARAAIVAVLVAADRVAWPGVAGGSARAVLQAHIEIALRCNKLVHGASQREVAEGAGVSCPTVRSARPRLIEARWLRLVERSQGTRAATYRLRLGRMAFPLRASTGGRGSD